MNCNLLTAEEDGVGPGDEDEGERDEEEAHDDDQQPEPPRLLPEPAARLRPIPGLHLLAS